jgi:hypothetical protein
MTTGVWQPLQAYEVPEHLSVLDSRERVDEVWRNDEYEVFVRYIEGARQSPRNGPLHLSIKRLDREPVYDWRHKQAIKNEVAGAEREAIELFPAESRLVDSANQTHLWVVGAGIQLEVGYRERMVGEQGDMMNLAVGLGYDPDRLSKARQRPWQAGISTGPVYQSTSPDSDRALDVESEELNAPRGIDAEQ